MHRRNLSAQIPIKHLSDEDQISNFSSTESIKLFSYCKEKKRTL